MSTKQQHKYQELFNHLNTKEINKLLKILKLDDNVVKDLKKKRRQYKNRLYAKTSRERMKLARKQHIIEIKKEIQDDNTLKLQNYAKIYCDLD